ncbi:MAG: MFS transporter [Chloroflexota bacterium]
MVLISQFSWWGSAKHKTYTVIIFVILSSLDNAATGIFPPLYGVIAQEMGITEAALGFVTAIRILVSALSAVMWGYFGDRGQRKRLLLYGTLIWSGALYFSGGASTYFSLFTSQLVVAIGLGCVSSVGFSLAGDFIPPERRGLVLSLWSLAQGIGFGIGTAISSTIGTLDWRLPFWLIASAGLVSLLLYVFSYEPARGQTQPELKAVFESGQTYTYRVQWSDLKQIVQIRSNGWLIGQTFFSTLNFGAFIWLPRFMIAKVEAVGYSLETATTAGSMLFFLFQMGVYLAIPAGYFGDRVQKRDLRGRAIIGTIGNFCAVPFHIAFFLIPLWGLVLPEQSGLIVLIWASISSMFTNGWVALTFVLALAATILGVIDNPNKAALIKDINLPEHRGTFVGLLQIAGGIGLSIGNALAGVAFTQLSQQVAPPWNYAVTLSLFQLLMLPAGYCFYRLIKTTPQDIITVRQTLAHRGQVR